MIIHKGGGTVPSERELNVDLLARLKIVKDALKLAEEEKAVRTVEYLKNEEYWLNQMLYQTMPLTNE